MAENKLMLMSHWFEDIKDLPEEIQNQVCANIVMYGLFGEEPNRGDITAIVLSKSITKQIDATKEVYAQQVATGRKGGRKKIVDDDQVYSLAKQGMTAKDIEAITGVNYKTVYSSAGWRKYSDEKKNL